ncbi:Pentatricopeptide repeat, partial [Dillenia turbinata]
MEHEHIKLDVIGSTCLIRYLSRVGKFSDCYRLLESMIRVGLMPNSVTFNILLDKLCKCGLVATANRILTYMKDMGISPVTTSYNILIHAAAKQGDGPLVENLLRDMYRQKLKPDVVTYGSLIHGLCKEGEISVAVELLDQMAEKGIKPSIAIYNMMVEALIRRGKFWDIFCLLEDMTLNGCEPDSITSEIVNRAMSKGWMKVYSEELKVLKLLLSGDIEWQIHNSLGEDVSALQLANHYGIRAIALWIVELLEGQERHILLEGNRILNSHSASRSYQLGGIIGPLLHLHMEK